MTGTHLMEPATRLRCAQGDPVTNLIDHPDARCADDIRAVEGTEHDPLACAGLCAVHAPTLEARNIAMEGGVCSGWFLDGGEIDNRF